MPTFRIGQLVALTPAGIKMGWGTPPDIGRVEKVEGTPYQELTVGVRWVGWHHGHNLEGSIRSTTYGAGGWWCHPNWLGILSPEEATLWLLAQ